ncbi:SGNH/GDSL hydrolase family protein [Companilactobacillus furfuricola]|uniref:SGNH/GDSL hydrolase family protein n=1 Tax=Companilactobacillus furfuricola TaxID=1462575 RepID=UPI0013DDC650|nr:SGNH/GDSL hydrolase family protein [Companilactobacillus furfuricola]
MGCSNKPATTEKSNKPAAATKIKASQPKSKPKTILETFKKSSKKQLQYYALGDSLSVGLFSDNQNTRFSTLFTKSLEDKTDKQVVESNTSSVGKTVTNFGIDHVQEVIAKHPDIVTVEFGTNDAAYGVDPVNVNNFVTNLNSVISELKHQTKAEIILMTCWSPSNGKYITNDQVYDQKIKEIGQKYQVPVVDLSTIWKNNPNVTKNDLGISSVYNIQKDEFHPNQSGHQAIADLLIKTVEETKAN